jgi:hypothetical protein
LKATPDGEDPYLRAALRVTLLAGEVEELLHRGLPKL